MLPPGAGDKLASPQVAEGGCAGAPRL